MKLENILLGLAKGGIEQRAVDAGEIDAVIDYANSNVVLLPAARRALREAGAWDSAASEAPEHRSSIVNSLLGALPKAEYQELLGGLELLALPLGEVLQQPGVPLAHVYFPVDCVIVLLATAEHERGLGVGLIGYMLVQRGRTALKQADLAPRQTIETLKEDVEWAKQQTN